MIDHHYVVPHLLGACCWVISVVAVTVCVIGAVAVDGLSELVLGVVVVELGNDVHWYVVVLMQEYDLMFDVVVDESRNLVHVMVQYELDKILFVCELTIFWY